MPWAEVAITQGAYPAATYQALTQARQYIAEQTKPPITNLLQVACLGALEEVSYTRKDGQCLRWDSRSGRTDTSLDKGVLPTIAEQVAVQATRIGHDIPLLKAYRDHPVPRLIPESCLYALQLGTMPGLLTVSSPLLPMPTAMTIPVSMHSNWSFWGYDDPKLKDLAAAIAIGDGRKTTASDKALQQAYIHRLTDWQQIEQMVADQAGPQRGVGPTNRTQKRPQQPGYPAAVGLLRVGDGVCYLRASPAFSPGRSHRSSQRQRAVPTVSTYPGTLS